MAYLILKVPHVLAAVVAVGSNATYGIWIAAGSRDPKVLPFALRGVKTIDDRMATPAYVLLLVTGAAMMVVGPIPITTPWLIVSFVLYVGVVLVGLAGYTPTLRRQIELLGSEGASSPGYRRTAARGVIQGVVIAVLTVTIIALMVIKPAFGA